MSARHEARCECGHTDLSHDLLGEGCDYCRCRTYRVAPASPAVRAPAPLAHEGLHWTLLSLALRGSW
jgi:hypothetical protein